MATIKPADAGSDNLIAFLDMIKMSELGPGLIRNSDDGYNVIVGSWWKGPAPKDHNLILFKDYADHPQRYIREVNSTAAGAYQLLGRYWPSYKAQLHLPDFGKLSQDKVALQLIRECRAVDTINAGKIVKAMELCKSRWASLPGAGYGQHEHDTDYLVGVFRDAGGKVA